MASKNYAKDIIYNMDRLLNLIRYDYDRARRYHKRIEIDSIFINDMIAQLHELIVCGYAPSNEKLYPSASRWH